MKLVKQYFFFNLIANFLFLVLLTLFFFKNSFAALSQENLQKQIQYDAQLFLKKCSQEYMLSACYAKNFAELTKSHSISYSLAVLQSLQGLDKRTKVCHEISHKIVYAEVAKNPAKWEEVLKKIDVGACQYGFVHGILEARGRYDSTFELNQYTYVQLVTLCQKMNPQITQKVIDNCAHILGHILLSETNAKIPPALNICSKVPQQYQYMCYSGVFMENIMRDNIVAHGVGERLVLNEKTKGELEGLCKSYTGIIETACWRHMSHVYAYLYASDPKKIYSGCSNIESSKSKKECYLLGVYSIAPFTPKEHYSVLCKPYELSTTEYRDCINSVMYSFLSAHSPISVMNSYCSTVPESFKKQCFSYFSLAKK